MVRFIPEPNTAAKPRFPCLLASHLESNKGPHLTHCSHKATLWQMIEIRKTVLFAEWLDGLRDLRARARVQVRIERLASGHVGDAKPVGEGVTELRIDYGPVIACTSRNAGVPS
jgi:hypothetical protein